VEKKTTIEKEKKVQEKKGIKQLSENFFPQSESKLKITGMMTLNTFLLVATPKLCAHTAFASLVRLAGQHEQKTRQQQHHKSWEAYALEALSPRRVTARWLALDSVSAVVASVGGVEQAVRQQLARDWDELDNLQRLLRSSIPDQQQQKQKRDQEATELVTDVRRHVGEHLILLSKQLPLHFLRMCVISTTQQQDTTTSKIASVADVYKQHFDRVQLLEHEWQLPSSLMSENIVDMRDHSASFITTLPMDQTKGVDGVIVRFDVADVITHATARLRLQDVKFYQSKSLSSSSSSF